MSAAAFMGPRVLFGRRRSTKTATGSHIVHSPRASSRSHSIANIRIAIPAKIPTTPMGHSVDIQIHVRDLASREPPGRVICTIWENESENETRWKRIGTSRPSYPSKRSISFDDKFPYSFVFERTQLIRVDLCRLHDGHDASPSDDVIGSCIFKVAELIGSFGLQIRKPLLHNVSIAATLANARVSTHSLGSILISGQMPEKEQPIVAQLHGKGLERKDFLWDETAVFFRVFRLEEGEQDDQLVLLYESEAIKNHSHPQWAEFRLDTHEAADNRNRLLEVWVLYRDVDGTEGFIGKFLTTYAKMKYGPGPDNVYHVINETKKMQKKSYEHSGKMELVKFTDVSFYSFLDYIVSGSQLHFELAVDFSSPEGDTPEDQKRFENEFQTAMRAVGGILKDYTPNRLFPAFGVGAKIPPTFHEAHEFHLNFQMDAACRGLDGVMEAYRKAQAAVVPMKESRLAPIVQHATRLSHGSGFRGLHYHVLTIFTRGTPVDMKDLQVALSAVWEAPLSVLFIGVGDGDFSALQKMAAKKKDSRRDAVEFISLAELLDSADTPAQNKGRIAEQVLHNVPQHMTSFMHQNNIAPKPPIQVCRSPLFHSSSLIPVHPTVFQFDDITPPPEVDSPRPQTDRRGSDSHFLDVDLLRNTLTVRVPERCHSVLQTTKEQYQRRLKERGLGKMRFPRVELSTLESSGGSTQDSLL